MAEQSLEEQIATIEKIRHLEQKYRKPSMKYEEMKKGLAKVDEFISEWLDSFPPLPDVIDLNEMSDAEAAITLYRAICEQTSVLDQSPAWEVMCLTPEMEAEYSDKPESEGMWRVIWEAGPYNWGIQFSLSGMISNLPDMPTFKNAMGSKNFVMEPYYSFDICFAPNS